MEAPFIHGRTGDSRCEGASQHPKRDSNGEAESAKAVSLVLHSLADPVYVADREHFRILYANDAFSESWGADSVGKTCYRRIHNRETPCAHCTRSNGEDANPLVNWEHHNDVTGKWYRCRQVDIPWPGDVRATCIQMTDITAFKSAEFALAERVKELSCLGRISSLLSGARVNAEVMNGVAEILSYGTQYPAVTRVKIVVDHEPFSSLPFEPTEWMLEADLFAGGVRRGSVQVYYLEKLPELYEGPFLKEERSLIDNVARMLGEAIRRSESERLYKDLYENAPDMYASVDLQTHLVVQCNQTLLRKLGYSREEVIGQSIIDLYAPGSVERAHNLCTAFAETGGVEDEELQLQCKDGPVLDVNLHVTAMVDDDGRIIQSRSSWRDISDRKTLERRLLAHEQSFAELITHMPIGWSLHELILDKSGRPYDYRYLDVNTAFVQLTGITREKAVGRCATEVIAGIEDLDLIQIYGEVTQEGEEKRFDMYYPPMDKWYRITAFRMGAGRFVTMFEDISDRKASEVALKTLNETLQRSNRELEQFAYVASHDLQEPLRMVASYTELLARRLEGQLDDKSLKYVGYAIDGARRMQGLINDLLSFSRLGTRGKPPEPVSSSDVLAEVLMDLKQRIEEEKADVQVGELPVVMADRTQLGQVFRNLVSNAIKFRREEEPPEVCVTAEKSGENWRFTVSDNGIGIEPKYHDRIFAIFQRLHGRDKYPGTGIGLAVVKKIVERHGGRIRVDSTVGEGTTFTFTLPAIDESQNS